MRDHRAIRAFLAAAVAACLLAGPPPSSAGPPQSDPQELFQRAETLYRQLQAVDPTVQVSAWSQVIGAFEELHQRYPDDPLSGEALWRLAWIHDHRAESGDPTAGRRAIDAYRQLVDAHPDSPHAPEAFFRLAAAAEGESGAGAARMYTRLLQRYPGTPQAALARNRLRNPELRQAEASAAAADLPGPDEEGGPAMPAAESAAPEVPAGEDAVPAGPTEAPDGDADLLPGSGDLRRLQGVRHYSDATHTRVVLDLDGPVTYEAGEAQDPARLFLDLQGVAVPAEIEGATLEEGEQRIPLAGDSARRVRVGINRPGVARVVVDLDGVHRYTLFTLDRPDRPFRIVIDVPSRAVAARVNEQRRPEAGDAEDLPLMSRQLGLGIRRIVLDPGHGGAHPGAIGRTGLTEKQLTLTLARGLRERLGERGYEVLLTREDDRTMGLEERTEFANREGADLFVSLHVNSARSRKLRGFETYYLDLVTDPSAAETAARENAAGRTSLADLDGMLDEIVRNDYKRESSALAESIQDALVMQVSKGYDEVKDLGVKSAPFVVLVGARMPAVLVETSFISNPEEEERLGSDDYRGRVVEAIELGIQNYVERRMTSVSR